MTTFDLDWTALGKALRQSALDAHEGALPPVELAYSFLLYNPECFLPDESEMDEPGPIAEWPADMPQAPNIELIAAYFNAHGGAV